MVVLRSLPRAAEYPTAGKVGPLGLIMLLGIQHGPFEMTGAPGTEIRMMDAVERAVGKRGRLGAFEVESVTAWVRGVEKLGLGKPK